MKERRKPYFSFSIVHVFVHIVEHIVKTQALFLQGEWEKFIIMSLVWEYEA